jgi:hypothetical protein
MEDRGLASLDVRPEAQREFNADLERRLRGSVWNSGGCASWYLDSQGCNRTIWPRQTWTFRRKTRRFDPASYRLEPARLGMEGEALPVHASPVV